jgi:CHAD domain-containing protein
MRSERYLALIDKLVDAGRAPVLAKPGEDSAARHIVAPLVKAQWRHLNRAVHALPKRPSDAEFHHVRIRAKRCRYAAEAAVPVIGKPAARFAAAIEDVQTVLGDHQDAVVAEAWLRATAPSVPKAGLAAGQLVARQQADRARLRQLWPDVWNTASAKKLRRWIS